jgi:LmbE family N-acetylglucosaminyl deacetylase
MTAKDGGSGGLLLVHAHPDDECFATGGLIARAIADGRRVDLVTCTGGEEGEIHDPALDPDEARPRLREIRRAELECAIRALGGGKLRLHLLGYRDSGMMGTPSNERADAFWRSDLDEATEKLVRIVREARPSTIVSYDINGNYGHPDHINAHRIAIAAWDAASDPARFEDAGQPHAVERFYETAFDREVWLGMMIEMHRAGLALPWDSGDTLTKVTKVAAERGISLDAPDIDALRRLAEALAEEPPPEGEEPEGFGTPDAEVTTRVDVSAFVEQKLEAFNCHKTQRQDFGWVLDLPGEIQQRVLSTEYFVLTRWRVHEISSGLREEMVFGAAG